MSLKKFLKRINTRGGSNYIWKVIPKCRCGTVKLGPPSVRRVFILGCCSRISLVDLMLKLHLVLHVISSLRYLGASPWMTLKVISRILKFMRYLTGSQCNSTKIGVI